ncbi:TAP-like protein-domain-containing protein [Xylariales sp. AK1849]|nr:TAP-like protein-domain-containing protein [Xylariales sp. AK1849]
MRSYQTIPKALLLTIAPFSAIALPNADNGTQQSIKWGSCSINGTLPISCGKLAVPLDYTDGSSDQTVILDLVKVDAAIQPSKGSILMNFGGPGGDGLHNLAPLAAVMQSITGGYHDLVSFDPRGTGNNSLTYSCYASDLERAIAELQSPQEFGNSSDTALGRLWAEGRVISDACYAQLEQIGSLVGTAFVARDMMEIVDALGEDGLLRYYGFSYGSVLGATVAALFPNRIDKIIIDGVPNPHQWYHGYDVDQFTDSDKVFSGFLSACAVAGTSCALARENRTAADLEAAMSSLFETIKYNAIPLGVYIIDYSSVKNFIFTQLYYPVLWPQMAVILDGLLTGNLTTLAEYLASLDSTADAAAITYESNAGIRCSDKLPRASTWQELGPIFDQLDQKSKWFGDLPASLILKCAQWRFEAKERYNGDFQVKTRNPMLLVGNTYDPTTPLVSAFNVSAGFEGSVVLQHNGYGHMSWVQHSNCTDRVIQGYLVNGTMPEPGTVCQPDVPLFPSVAST